MISLLLLTASAYQLRSGVTPVQKVISLMEEMSAKGVAEKALEATQHTEYMGWCTDTSRAKKFAITQANADIEKLDAAAEKAAADVTRLSDEIAELDGNMNTWSQEKADATALREEEHATYMTTHTDYVDSLDAMSRALSQLASRNVKLSTLQLSKHPRLASLAAFLQTSVEPSVSAYEFHSGGIMDTVKELQSKMQEEKSDLEAEEGKKRHSHQMLVQQLSDDLEFSEDERTTKAAQKAQREEDGATARADASSTRAKRDEDEDYLRKLVAQCEQKAGDFAARQQLRTEELAAIAKATEIIKGGSVLGAASTHLPSFVQTRMLRATPLQKRVAVFLQGRATKSQSRVLALIASKVGDSPFDKVAQMIQKLIARLEAEAADEAEHKGWCDGELQSNKQSRDAKTQQVELLTARSEQLTAQIAKLSAEIAELNAQTSAANQAYATATENRLQEKNENKVAVEDATEAIAAVESAIAVLKEFYGSAASATSLVQSRSKGPGDDAPASFDTPYKGMQSTSGGVIGMLDVILSDFTRLKSETSAEEAAASQSYDSFSAESKADVAALTKTADAKSRQKLRSSKDLSETAKDLRSTHEELDGAVQYWNELKPACVDAQVSYSDRVQRRDEEIQSLNEALSILGN